MKNARTIKAGEYFKQGYNCCQSVVLAYADITGLDPEALKKLASSFGGGMGRLREVCGAVTGIFMIAGLKYGYTDPTALEEKTEQYDLIQKLAKQFKDQNGSILCRDLVQPEDGSEASPPSFEKCGAYIESAIEILEKTMSAQHK